MNGGRESAIRALVRSWNRLPGGGAGWFSLGIIVAATAAVAVLFWLEPLARRIDRASSTLAGLFYLLGFLTLNTTAHLNGHWRRHGKPRLRMTARRTGAGAAFTYSLAGVDDVVPPDPAIRAIPAVIAIGAALLGFAAAMTIVAVWTRPEALGRDPWIGAYWIALILLVMVAAARRITREISDLYDWAVDCDERARAAVATPAGGSTGTSTGPSNVEPRTANSR